MDTKDTHGEPSENSGLPAVEHAPDETHEPAIEPLTPAATDPEDQIPLAEVATEDVEAMTGLDLPEEEVPESAAAAESYFADDEEFLRGDDRTLETSDDAGLVQQLDNVVSYNLVNFYTEDGKRRGKYSLRNDPPVFRVEASSGDTAEFVVTRELSEHLAHLFDTVRRGYYGVDSKKKRTNADGEPVGRLSEVTEWLEANPKRAAIIVGLLLLALLTAFLI